MRISDWSSDVCSSDLYDKGCGSLPLRRSQRSVGRKPAERRGARVSAAFELGDVGDGPDLSGSAGKVRVAAIGAAAMLDKLGVDGLGCRFGEERSEEHTSELQSLMRISYVVFCLKKKTIEHDSVNKRIRK